MRGKRGDGTYYQVSVDQLEDLSDLADEAAAPQITYTVRDTELERAAMALTIATQRARQISDILNEIRGD